METNQEILSKIKEKYPFLVDISKIIVVENIICISCYVSNSSTYFIIYPTGEIKYKTKDDWDYTSAFNSQGFGNGVAFIDLVSFDLIKVYYYKDALNFDQPIIINYVNKNFLITEHEERTHIIFLDNFSVSSFGGNNFRIYEPYILFFPYAGYSTYGTFAIIDTTKKHVVNLAIKLSMIREIDDDFNEPSVIISEERKNLLYQYRSTGETFCMPLSSIFADSEILHYKKTIEKPQKYYRNFQLLEGSWEKGYSLDTHTVKSTYNSDGSFNTERSYIGELLYQIKYRFDKSKIKELSEIISYELGWMYFYPFELIIPVPPSNLNRPFQPLIEIAKELSFIINKPLVCDLVVKVKTTPPIKQIEDEESRKELLENAFVISNKSYRGRNVLLIDDLYRSGETLNAVAKVLKTQGEVGHIYVLTITKTRTKK
jgi:predicted amidophosphoribosyltransferase